MHTQETPSPLRLLAASAPYDIPHRYTATGRALRWLAFTLRALLAGAGWILSIVLRAGALVLGLAVALCGIVGIAAGIAAALIGVGLPVLFFQLGKLVLARSRQTAAAA